MLIVLMTDFGVSHFVGQMKGRIQIISPNTKVIDLTHSIEKFNIIEAGFTLFNSINHFPNKSIFVCVVDPGVGSNRRSIIIQTEKNIFIGPDNGLFTLIADQCNLIKVIEINNTDLVGENIGSTFHGRDIFAPVAANINNGVNLNEFGSEINPTSLIKISAFYPYEQDNSIIGNVIYSDTFGNLITNIHSSFLYKKNYSLEFLDFKIGNLAKTFSDVEIGELVAYIGSSSYLEIALNQSSLKSKLIYDNKLTNSDLKKLIVKIIYH